MAVIKCPWCGKEIGDKDGSCPYCGFHVKKRSGIPKWIWIVVIAVFLLVGAVCLLINNFNKIMFCRMISPSMENTIDKNEKIICDLSAYKSKTPERGDIVVFKYPDNRSEKFVARIIGLPGEKVEIIDGEVFINDSDTPLDSSFCPEEPEGTYGPYQVPEGAYFLLGDNRNHAMDSRFWDYNYVPAEDIVGKVRK